MMHLCLPPLPPTSASHLTHPPLSQNTAATHQRCNPAAGGVPSQIGGGGEGEARDDGTGGREHSFQLPSAFHNRDPAASSRSDARHAGFPPGRPHTCIYAWHRPHRPRPRSRSVHRPECVIPLDLADRGSGPCLPSVAVQRCVHLKTRLGEQHRPATHSANPMHPQLHRRLAASQPSSMLCPPPRLLPNHHVPQHVRATNCSHCHWLMMPLADSPMLQWPIRRRLVFRAVPP